MLLSSSGGSERHGLLLCLDRAKGRQISTGKIALVHSPTLPRRRPLRSDITGFQSGFDDPGLRISPSPLVREGWFQNLMCPLDANDQLPGLTPTVPVYVWEHFPVRFAAMYVFVPLTLL